MNKLEFTLWILMVLGITYFVLTGNMGFIAGNFQDAAASVAADHPGVFPTTEAALNFAPLLLYLAPAAWLIFRLIQKWREKGGEEG